MSTKIKEKIKELATLSLENAGVHRDYTDEDLSDAVIILLEVFMSKMFDKHKDRLTQEQLEQLSTEAGKSMHQTVQLFTGVDLHKIYKK